MTSNGFPNAMGTRKYTHGPQCGDFNYKIKAFTDITDRGLALMRLQLISIVLFLEERGDMLGGWRKCRDGGGWRQRQKRKGDLFKKYVTFHYIDIEMLTQFKAPIAKKINNHCNQLLQNT